MDNSFKVMVSVFVIGTLMIFFVIAQNTSDMKYRIDVLEQKTEWRKRDIEELQLKEKKMKRVMLKIKYDGKMDGMRKIVNGIIDGLVAGVEKGSGEGKCRNYEWEAEVSAEDRKEVLFKEKVKEITLECVECSFTGKESEFEKIGGLEDLRYKCKQCNSSGIYLS